MAKSNIDRVIPPLAERALSDANGDCQLAWTKYILLHYRATGKLAPGCDNRDLQEFYKRKVSDG